MNAGEGGGERGKFDSLTSRVRAKVADVAMQTAKIQSHEMTRARAFSEGGIHVVQTDAPSFARVQRERAHLPPRSQSDSLSLSLSLSFGREKFAGTRNFAAGKLPSSAVPRT